MSLSQSWLRSVCDELKALPDGWTIKATPESSTPDPKRIYFQSPDNETTFHHPTLGPLPKPWILRLCTAHDEPPDRLTGKPRQYPRYFNKALKTSTKEDPRFSPDALKARSHLLNRGNHQNIAGSLVKMKPGMAMESMKREDIGEKDFRGDYDILKAIDPGDGSVGGMNGGVFVVRLKNQNRLCVEKRFKRDGVAMGLKEIKMLHRLKHASLTLYTAGFVLPDLSKASVYVEFCDRGSLEDVICNYQKHALENSGEPRMMPPERFIWHAFAGLCDGLAYLLGGRSYVSEEVTDHSPVHGWVPILHRDVKPDNVLLRSRDTLGSNRYFYCVLSDFGLATENWPDSHPKADKYQKLRTKLGTPVYYAPEMLYNPYPTSERQRTFWPDGYRHSFKTDMWALGAALFNLAECRAYGKNKDPTLGSLGHLMLWKKPPNIDNGTFMEGTISRIPKLEISPRYSSQLRAAIQYASRWNPDERPDALKMIKQLKGLIRQAGYTNNSPAEHEQLPKWATRVHDYHSREPLDPRKFNN